MPIIYRLPLTRKIDYDEIKFLLKKVEGTIHEAQNRVRYVMNGFIIAVGAWYEPLLDEAKRSSEYDW